MQTFRPGTILALLGLAALAGGMTPSPAAARATHTAKHTARRHAAAPHRARVAVSRPKFIRGIGTHGTATTGAGQGTSTNIVPAGGTNSDPLGGGTTSTGTATNGGGVSNK